MSKCDLAAIAGRKEEETLIKTLLQYVNVFSIQTLLVLSKEDSIKLAQPGLEIYCEMSEMCVLRANIVTNCRKCKSSARYQCTLKRRTSRKFFTDNKASTRKG